MLEGIDLTSLLQQLAVLSAAVVAVGVTVSKFTKTDKDDKFWARVGQIFSPKKTE